MALTVKLALDRLHNRKSSLTAERQRIEITTTRELARVDAQLAAIDIAITSLEDPQKARTAGALLTALDGAGLTLEIKE